MVCRLLLRASLSPGGFFSLVGVLLWRAGVKKGELKLMGGTKAKHVHTPSSWHGWYRRVSCLHTPPSPPRPCSPLRWQQRSSRNTKTQRSREVRIRGFRLGITFHLIDWSSLLCSLGSQCTNSSDYWLYFFISFYRKSLTAWFKFKFLIPSPNGATNMTSKIWIYANRLFLIFFSLC